jgi:hypothetical protein
MVAARREHAGASSRGPTGKILKRAIDRDAIREQADMLTAGAGR